MPSFDLDNNEEAIAGVLADLEEGLVTWSFRPEFGGYLRDLRETARLSLREAGERAGVPHTLLARLETGRKAKQPPVDAVRRIADAYGVDQAEVLARGGFFFLIPRAAGHSTATEDEFRALVLSPELRPASLEREHLDYFSPKLMRQWVQFAKKLAAHPDPAGLVERLLAAGREGKEP